MNKIKKIILVGHDNSGSFYLMNRIVSAFPDVSFELIETTGIYYKKSLLQSIIKLVRESSIIFCAARFFEMLKYRLGGRGLAALCSERGISHHKTPDINSDHTISLVERMDADLIVSLYTMHIFKQKILSLTKFGAITSHPSILPEYRGLEVFFWAMANNEENIGVSVFTVEPKVDAGRVIREVVMPLRADQTMQAVYEMITVAAGELLETAIRDIDADTAVYRTPEGEGSYYPMPTRAAVWRFLRAGKRFF